MNTFFSQLKKDAENIRLSSGEREGMRRVLEGAMQENGLVKSPIRVHPSPYLFMHQRLVSGMAFVALVAFVGGGTAYAAENALPGDMLYAVKLNINESVRIALARSPESKARRHAEAVDRRIQEAETLAARGTLTEEVKAALEESFDSHAEALEENIARVEEDDPAAAADISTRFESSLLAHSALVLRLAEEGGNDVSRRESVRFADRLRQRGERIALAARPASVKAERAENGDIALMAVIETPPEANARTASIVIRDSGEDAVITRLELSASTTLDEAQAYLDDLQESLDATTSARVQAQIGKMRGSIELLKKERAGNFIERERVQQILRDASKVRAFLEAQGKFKGRVLLPAPDISENGDVDSTHEREEDEALQKGYFDKTILPAKIPIEVSI